MKKFLFGVFTFFIFCQVFGNAKECKGCPKPDFEKYYFSASQLIVNNDNLFINIENNIVPLTLLEKDGKGYFTFIRKNCTLCEHCGDWTWNIDRGCCLNPPSECRYSCEWRTWEED